MGSEWRGNSLKKRELKEKQKDAPIRLARPFYTLFHTYFK
ncbi:hypothetical protein GCM10009001_26530 [Virgibacillus siamensis]|uniref:Uncharacterized protein n=1 Tax=Virgibacillus siamensis TaxID=480071 RepID=A0ABN1GBG6_9BACI